jgi:predicted ribosomally synthesized peptide with nif11-like leader
MSREDARSFLTRLERDVAFRQSITKALQGHDAERLVGIGAEHGLSFTASELADAADEKRPESELSDAELETVAGGSRRSPLYDLLSQIIAKYNEAAKTVADNLRG